MIRSKTAAFAAAIVWFCTMSVVRADPGAPIPTVPIPVSPTGIRPILINTEAPGPILQNSLGQSVDLTSVLGKRATILVFYRAHW
jgi:hypothetical protein